jgi:FtsP/CotA-like multicopper oxidase with cupredoxin domain
LPGHETADALYPAAEAGGPPTLDNGLINGQNVYGTAGSRYEMTFTKGETHLIRLVNGAIDTHFKFMIDNHTFAVVTSDLVAIEPYSASVLDIGIGQRYDIIVKANQTAGNYWLRAIPQVACSDNDNSDNIKAIVTYSTVSIADPTTTAYDYVDGCDDETANIVPYLSMDAGAEDNEDQFEITVGQSGAVFKWFVSDTTFMSEWDDPSLLQVWNNETSFKTQEHVISLPDANTWTYFIIETAVAVPHPIHLHGHDFYILAQETGTYGSDTVLNTSNPPRRDVALLPASGYLVIAFLTDNPGAWLMHCHIGWHTSEGFALQLVERQSEIAAIIDYDILNSTCSAWNSYEAASGIVEDDSGV